MEIKSKTNVGVTIFGITVLAILVSLIWLPVKAQNNPTITEQDGMGTTYIFNIKADQNRVNYEYQDYSQRVNESGFLRATDPNILVEGADNSVFVVYLNNTTLQVMSLSATPDYPSAVGKIITLETGLSSISGDNVQIFDVRRYGIYVSWEKNGETYYAIIDRWYGLREKGNSAQAQSRGITLPTATTSKKKTGDSQSDVTGSIKGKSYVIVVDSSSSMGGKKIEKAKEEVTKLVNKLSSDDEMALFIFERCGNVSLIQGFTQNKQKILGNLSKATASGGSSPVAESIETGRQYLEDYHHGAKGKLMIYTDGGENCNGDPIAAAKTLRTASIDIDFEIVGYNLKPEAKDELKEITKAGGGKLDEETVYYPEQQKTQAKKNAKKAAGAAAAGAMGSLFAYWASGGVNLAQRFSSLFGSDGLFKFSRFSVTTPKGGAPSTQTPASSSAKTSDTSSQPKEPKEQKARQEKEGKPKTDRKFCTNCGAPMAPGSGFCVKCGNKL